MEEKAIDNRIQFEIYQELGECYAHVGRRDEAVEHFEKASILNPQSERPFIGLGVMTLQGGDSLKAQEYFLKAVGLNPNSDNALTGLGMALSTNGSQAEGLARFQEALDLNPENMPALMGLLQSAHILDQLPIAERYLRKYLELHVADLKVLYCLAGVCFKLGKYKEAREAAGRILIFEPENRDALSLMEKIEEEEKVISKDSSSGEMGIPHPLRYG